jgi:hypothetical protein
MSSYNPIKILVFLTQDEAINEVNSFNYGMIKKEENGVSVIEISDNPEPVRDTKEDIYFSSQTDDAFYSYTIEKHEITFVLKVYRTIKHGMISAAITGNLTSFRENFDDREKMIEFSLSTAVINGNWNIVEYLIDNYRCKNNPLWLAIRYDKLDIVKRLLLRGMILPTDWLAYSMYSNSLNVIKELLEIQKVHLKLSTEELTTKWFIKELRKETPIVQFVKNVFFQ